MNTYLTTTLSEPVGTERIPNGTFGYLRARNRHLLYNLIIKEFKKSELTQADLARRSGKPPETICRWLATPGNMRVDSLSDLLFAISGATPTYELDYPLKQPARNDTRPEWLIDLQAANKPDKVLQTKVERIASSAVEANKQHVQPRPINRDSPIGLGISSTSATHQLTGIKPPEKSVLEPSV